MEIDVEYLNKWASLTRARARLEEKLFDPYMNFESQVLVELGIVPKLGTVQSISFQLY